MASTGIVVTLEDYHKKISANLKNVVLNFLDKLNPFKAISDGFVTAPFAV